MDGSETTATLPAAPAPAIGARKPRVWHLFVLLVLSLVLVILIVAMAAGVIAAARGLINDHTPPAEVNRVVSQMFRTPQIAVVALCASAALSIALALVVGMLSPHPFVQRLRVGRGHLSGTEVAVATIGFLAFSLGFDALEQRLPGYDHSAITVLRDLFRDRVAVGLPFMAILVGLVAPLGEELFYRGALQTRFAERYGHRVGLLIASLCFALAHMDVLHSLFAFLAGLYLGWVCDLAASCRASFVVHGVNNLMAVAGSVWFADGDDPFSGAGAMAVSFAVTAMCVTWLRRRIRDRTGAAVVPRFSTPLAGV